MPSPSHRFSRLHWRFLLRCPLPQVVLHEDHNSHSCHAGQLSWNCCDRANRWQRNEEHKQLTLIECHLAAIEPFFNNIRTILSFYTNLCSVLHPIITAHIASIPFFVLSTKRYFRNTWSGIHWFTCTFLLQCYHKQILLDERILWSGQIMLFNLLWIFHSYF